MMINNDNYYIIQGWMINELKLKGNELCIYAIIFGFSQDGKSRFTGSLSYLSEWTGACINTVQNTLKSLVKKGLISKYNKTINNVKYCEYKVTSIGYSKNCDTMAINDIGGYSKNCDKGIAKIANNNIEYKEDNIYTLFENFWQLYPNKKNKQKAQDIFIKLLKNNKVTYDKLINGLDKYIQHIKASNTEMKYVKHPTTWLNGYCWEDEYYVTKGRTNDGFF